MIVPDLRPLGLGEMLDRAVTVFIRNFWMLVTVLAAVSIPVAFVSYFIHFDANVWAAGFGRAARTASTGGLPGAQGTLLAALISLVSWVAQLLSGTACAIAIAEVYGSRTIIPREAYRRAWARLRTQVVTMVAFIAIVAVAFVVLGFLLVLLALPVGGILQTRPSSPIVIAYVSVLALIFLTAAMMCLLIAEMAFVSVAVEDASVGFALRTAIKRTFAKAMFWRSLLTALIFLTVTLLGGFVLGALGGMLDAMLHLKLFVSLVEAIGEVPLTALTTCFLVIYYFDVRVRHEGYDLFLQTQVLEPA